MKRYYIVLAVCIFCLLSRADAHAQDTREAVQINSPIDLEIQKAIEALQEVQLLRELQLPEDKAAALIHNLRDGRVLRQNYLLQRYVIEQKLHALLDEPAREKTEIANMLQKLEFVKLQYYQQVLKNDAEIEQLLTPEEHAQYILFQRDFNKKLKEVIAKIHGQSIDSPSKQHQLLRRESTESVIRQPR